MLSRYIGGIIELTKDALRLMFYFLKRPHYTAAVLLLIIGIFYLNGIPPQEISGFLSGKWQAFVENRKQTFREDMQIISGHFSQSEEQKPVENKEVEQQLQMQKQIEEAQSYQQRIKEEENWKTAFEEARGMVEISGENVVEGVLSVVSAGEIRLNGQTFLLKARIRPGKAGDAYQQMKSRFDGRQAKCVPDKDDSKYAECFVGVLGVSEMLIDFNLADPL
ncbi:MAG: hypothetical protein J5787_09935 [Alphaproteobacteria bacterium]|nr:hypothetical protein [Alphaproteobacteria bacterium]MBO4643011.1 hypothetical protein [Alphaproteobacteria bacterium]